MAFDNILVVCVGNICRSPMAEALLKQRYPHKNIDSAGVGALVGHSADPAALEIMAGQEIDITNHVAKQIDEGLAKKADLIFTMSDSQTKWIEERWPFCRGKTFKLGHWQDKDIADPYKHEMSAFQTAYQDIVVSLEQWADKIS
ncbi:MULTISPECIES: low molecular weight protein-tyrosine-phosphatase [Psychrobacter]|jgi:protein-tyrosine phosphatase|uniref:protein-tyrosine-phosphatase n=1 Tax=Psychrobacter faecalis TaxID=180588 RepID=A0ABT9HJ60_9GAMM|nr:MULTISPECIES: low molecular weight protein-tyrosine-phosphatase [Psychrobacter]MDP4545687.1 low molecular weight protein-tyrosine-phosphatase [Psychrobacter faecalis]OAP71952.1 protein tyrosine phosphatase [Psychrobacter sp. SHUES1]WLW67006.1 low molecular weight protein-tyrosine-phosphatase [Psychrobacter sp. van23A]|tara:strand:- start:2284 stop:2715 length:432 start_codon:yes stop_codon:yes gene_type:complete